MCLPNHIFSRFASAPISVVQTITASYSTPSEAWVFKKNNSDQIPAFCGEATLYGDVLQLQVGLCMLLDELNVDFYFLLAIPQRWSLTKSETKQYHIVPFMFLPCSQVFFILFLLISQKKNIQILWNLQFFHDFPFIFPWSPLSQSVPGPSRGDLRGLGRRSGLQRSLPQRLWNLRTDEDLGHATVNVASGAGEFCWIFDGFYLVLMGFRWILDWF